MTGPEVDLEERVTKGFFEDLGVSNESGLHFANEQLEKRSVRIAGDLMVEVGGCFMDNTFNHLRENYKGGPEFLHIQFRAIPVKTGILTEWWLVVPKEGEFEDDTNEYEPDDFSEDKYFK